MVERAPKKDIFKKPSLVAEKGEFLRVAQAFGIEDSVLFYSAENEGKIVTLDDDTWSMLENSDSYHIPKDGHEIAAALAEESGRDYHVVADAIYGGVMVGEPLDAPIVMKIGERYHLVSGNTRLMAARAYGVTPNVLLFEVDQVN